MKSSINKLAYTFLFSACSVLLFGAPLFAKPVKGQVRSKYGDFINIDAPSWNLNIKPGSSPILTLKSGTDELTISSSGSKNIYQLTTVKNNLQYELYALDDEIVILTYSRETKFNDSACLLSTDPFKGLLAKNLTTQIEEFAYADNLLDKSCDSLSDDDRQQLFDLIGNGVNPPTSFIVKCFQSEKFKAEMAKNQKTAVAANKVLASYLNEMSKIESGESQLKIRCSAGDKAKYLPNESALVFPTKDGSLVGDKCKDVNQVLAHELFHHAGLQDKEIAALDSKCARSLDLKVVSNKSCKGVYDLKEIEGVGVQAAVRAEAAKQNKKENKELAQAIATDIKPTEFVPIAKADVEQIANPTSPEAYTDSVERVQTGMETTRKKMSNSLNRFVASTVSTARAEPAAATTTTSKSSGRDSVSKTTIANIRQPASAKSFGNEEYPVQKEILAKKLNVPGEAISAAVAAPAPTDPNAKIPSIAAVPKRKAGEAAAGPVGNGEIAASNRGGGGGAIGDTSTAGGVAGRTVSSGAKTNSRNIASTGAASGTDPIVEQLGQFNELRGQKYRLIQDQYNDPTFDTKLREKNLAIEYRQNNKTITIGDTSNKRTLFLDNGTVLKKVTGAR